MYAYDLKKRQIGDLLLSHNRYDIGEDGSLVMAPGSRQLLGIRYTADVPVTVWLDPDFKALQAAFDQAMPGKVNTITSMSDDLQHVILYSESDRDAGTYYQFDRKTQEMKILFATRPMLKPDLMGKSFPASFKARDGVVVHGYLTIPRGRDPKNLPLVVYPHDGPWERNNGLFDDEVQFLSNRGYAVMQINYRGSYGYGEAFARRDSQHIQKEAYNDVVDGTRWAVEKGIADPKHVAIMGEGFFSGYLALNGITQTPELYCCAISGDGVSDWLEQFAFVKKTNADSYDNIVAHFGDPVKAKDELIDMSPITHVQNIKGPVLLLYSAWSGISEDTSNALKSALKKAGKSYEILDQHNGDSFYRLKIRKELFTKIETFLATNMPTETGPAVVVPTK